MYIQMTEEEVRRDVRLAKYPTEQVEILSQINGVPKAVIQRILDGESWDEATDDVKANVARESAGASTYPERVVPSQAKAAPVRRHKAREVAHSYHKWTLAELMLIKKYRDEGKSRKEIGVILSVPENSIGSIMHAHPEIFSAKRKTAHDVGAS